MDFFTIADEKYSQWKRIMGMDIVSSFWKGTSFIVLTLLMIFYMWKLFHSMPILFLCLRISRLINSTAMTNDGWKCLSTVSPIVRSWIIHNSKILSHCKLLYFINSLFHNSFYFWNDKSADDIFFEVKSVKSSEKKCNKMKGKWYW